MAVAALALYRMRLADISMRDHIFILWVVLGDRHLRAHDGNAYFYNAKLGCWEMYNGLFPDYIYGEIKTFLLELESAFRDIEGG